MIALLGSGCRCSLTLRGSWIWVRCYDISNIPKLIAFHIYQPDLLFEQLKSMDILLTCSHYVTQSAQVIYTFKIIYEDNI